MQRTDHAGRAAQLVIELASGTAILHGEEIELPLREFRLLAALAERVGDPVETSSLIERVWPDAPYTTSQDLYVLVSKLRRRIKGADQFGKNIRNRRGFGYILDLPPHAVAIIDSVASDVLPIDRTSEQGSHEASTPVSPPTTAQIAEEIPSEVVTAQEEAVPVAPPRPGPTWLRRSVVIAAVASFIGASWVIGFALSSRTTEPPATTNEEEKAAQGQAIGDQPARSRTQDDGGNQPRNKTSNRRSRQGNGGPSDDVVVAAPQAPQAPAAQAREESSSQDEGSRKASMEKAAAPQPPPAPTRYLYHLQDPDSGDHFVTTDADLVGTYQARGYEGGAIGRIYTEPEEGTKAVTTNRGTAYIFTSSNPKTEPASSTVALYYSSNDRGDFFYTTNQGEASQDGWRSSLIGWVRTP